MNISGNTILITGGGTGIGRGLAEAFHAAGNAVVIAGRRPEPLQSAVAANPGMASEHLDIADPASILDLAQAIVSRHPKLNVLINNAGVMGPENLTAETVDLATAEATITTNVLGPMRLTAALLPHLRKQPAAAIINVTSGLAYVPVGRAPSYCASKAALRSYTQTLRFQLRDTSVQVIELAPPLVATDLQPLEKSNPRAMSLDDYIAESMALLRANPGATEIYVERVKLQRYAEARGEFDKVFDMLNSPPNGR
jgi:uncharacterized oxidoreductase